MNNVTIENMMRTLITNKFYQTKEEAQTILAMYLGMCVLSPEKVTELMLLADEVYKESIPDTPLEPATETEEEVLPAE